jgi:hypothetical protein
MSDNSIPGFDEQRIEQWSRALLSDHGLLEASWKLKRFTAPVLEQLSVGFDGECFTFPIRDDGGALIGLVRYAPAPLRVNGQPKSKADAGTTRELFPQPDNGSAEIWLTEGEPDAITARSAGLPAVGVPGTSGWKSKWAVRFEGMHVTICFDCDKVGRDAAPRIAADLEPYAASVRIIDLDPARDDGYDLADFLADAETPDELPAAMRLLRDMERRAPIFEPPSPPPPPVSVEAIPITSFTARRVDWLWASRIPLGMLTLLFGMPDRGKSLLSILIAAERTRAGRRVLITTAEDSIAEVVKPRLEAARAVLDLVEIVKVKRHGVEDGLTLPDDMDQLEALVDGHELLVIDPLNAHLPGTVNSLIDASVRRALAPLHRMAERTRCAVLPIGHVNKNSGLTDPLLRSGGSIGLPGAVRSMLLMANDPDDPDGPDGLMRVLAHVKCNVGPKQLPHLTYTIERLEVDLDDERIDTARLKHTGEAHHSMEALLGATPTSEERNVVEEAIEWLAGELAGGAVAVRNIIARARAIGLPERTVRTAAKDHLHVISERVGFGSDGIWSWRLPDDHEDGGNE